MKTRPAPQPRALRGPMRQARPAAPPVDTRRRVLNVIAEQVRQPAAALRSDLRLAEDLGIDSLGEIELVMRLEHVFRIDLPDEDCSELRTVGNVVDEVLEKVI